MPFPRNSVVTLVALAVATTLFAASFDAAMASDSPEPGNGRHPRILYLNSYHYGYEWSDSLGIGALQVFRQSAPEARVYIEYLDGKHFELTEERKKAELDRILAKYGPDFFDIVVTSDDPAFDFMRTYRDVLTPGKPVVFSGINAVSADDRQIPEGFTGIVEPFDYHGIVSMVRNVFPERKNGYLIVDNSVTGRALVAMARKLAADVPDMTLNVLDGADLSHEDLLGILRGLGRDAFVIIGVWQTDRNGHYFNVSEAFQDIINASTAPVFVILRTSLAIDYAGGSAISGVHQGRVAAGMALRILEGTPVSSIPVTSENIYDRMLNRSAIETRWGVRFDELPAEIQKIPEAFPPETEAPYTATVKLSSDESDYISRNPVVRVALVDDPPIMIPGASPAGMAVEYMNELASLTGLRFEWVTCARRWKDCDGVGEAVDNALVLPAVAETHEGRDKYIFSVPYLRMQSVIFTRDDSRPIIGPQSLKGLKVAVRGKSFLYRQLRQELDGLDLVPFDTSRDAMIALHDGEVDAFVVHLSIGVTLAREMGFRNIRIAAPTNLPPQPFSIAVPLEMPLLASIIDKGMSAMPADTVERLRSKYMQDVEFKWGWSTESVLKLVLAVVSVFLIVVFVLLVRARRIKNASVRRELNLQVTLDSIGDAVIVTDNGDRVVRMNPIARRLTGYDDAEARAKPIAEVMALVDPDTNRTLPIAEAGALTDDDRPRSTSRIQLNGKDGARYLVEASASKITGVHGEKLGQVIVFRDVSRRMQIQDQIQHSRKMEAIGQLAGGVAHDFNNMLSAIQGYSELILKRAPAGSNEVVYCERILNATERAAGLTSKLLDFARKGKALSTPIDIHESIKSALALLERSIDKSIVITSALEACDSLIVGDPGQIQSIILNLCINARDAMPSGGTLEISTRNVMLNAADCRDNEFPMNPGEHVVICVQDSGTGIPAGDLEHIFEPFFTTKEVGKGTGLGLAAVHGAILEHAGAIKVYSELGKGTRFTIYLPVSQESRTCLTEAYVADLRHHGTVLVVEDEGLIRGMADVMLRDMGFDVLLAENGAEGVELFRQNTDRIRLVLMDVIMPEMDGMAALKAIREIRPDTLFIVTSGFSFEHRRDEFMKAGATAFIGKPFRNADLAKVVDEALKG